MHITTMTWASLQRSLNEIKNKGMKFNWKQALMLNATQKKLKKYY